MLNSACSRRGSKRLCREIARPVSDRGPWWPMPGPPTQALTRRFRALKIWFSVKVLGLSWFRELVRRSCRLTEFAQGLLEEARAFEILSPRQLSIVCFRYKPSEFSAQNETGEQKLDRLN